MKPNTKPKITPKKAPLCLSLSVGVKRLSCISVCSEWKGGNLDAKGQ